MVLKYHNGFLFLFATLLATTSFCRQVPRMELVDGTLSALNLDEKVMDRLFVVQLSEDEWSKLFPVFTRHSYDKGIYQPIAGQYSVHGPMVCFKPLFPFAEGETYCSEFDYEKLVYKSDASLKEHDNTKNIKFKFTFTIPASGAPLTSIEAVYPAVDTLPENVLRMYIHFSAPMSTGEAYQHINLTDENGSPVEKPFLVIDQELWDAGRQRFTLFFDPGRIKRGIRSNEEMGPPLKKNHAYHLVIDSLWRDERGNGLLHSYQKNFYVKAAERKRLTCDPWKIIAPVSDSKNALIVKFEKPLDHALALKFISVMDPFQGIVKGTACLNGGDREWIFVPEHVWSAGRYLLSISPNLEDPAGNNFNNPFDIDLGHSSRQHAEEPKFLVFTVKSEAN